MNIDRAIILFAGLLLLTGTTLAAFVSPWWLLVPAFVGLNMTQASLTGFCPAALILGKLGLREGPAFLYPLRKRSKLHLLPFLLLAGLAAAPAHAQSLEDALILAYQNNPALMAQRAKLRATDEKVPEALGGYRPTLALTGGVGQSRAYAASAGTDSLTPRDAALEIKQPIFSGFKTTSAVDSAEAQVKAQRAILENAEQETLYQAAKAYLDVLRSQKILELTQSNESVLTTNLAATNERLRVGEVTKTDTAQSEARLSAATARRIKAQGDLAADRAAYIRVIGAEPASLQQPQIPSNAPSAFDEVIQDATTHNPAILAADHTVTAAQANITQAQGALLPDLSLVGTLSHAQDQSVLMQDRQNAATIMARLTIPLYTSGSDDARIRAAKETEAQKRYERTDIRQQIRELATRAWQNLKTAQAAIIATKAQRDAAQLALRGVQEERAAGTRTVLDVLNAEQELLSANVDLVQADHDQALALLQIKAAIGKLTAQAIGLSVPAYDPKAHYEKVRGKWIGTSID